MLKSYKCSIDGEQWTAINAISRGAAKAHFFRTFDSDIKYTWVRCKSNGSPYTSDEFQQTQSTGKLNLRLLEWSLK